MPNWRITLATRCKAYHEPYRLVEDRKKAVELACLLKVACSNQKCKQSDNKPTMLMTKKVDLSMKLIDLLF